MHAATTKIPHLLNEKDLLENPEWNVGFYLQLMIYLQWMLYDRDGRKTLKYTKNEYENQGKIPRLVDLPSPRLWNGGLLFSGVRKHRKQAGTTQGGRGILA